MRAIRRALDAVLVHRDHKTLLIVIVVGSLILSLLVGWIVRNAGLPESERKSIGNLFGYVGALALFVPEAIGIVMDYRSRRLREFVDKARGDGRKQLEAVYAETNRFSDAIKLKSKFASAIGFLMVTVGFILGV